MQDPLDTLGPLNNINMQKNKIINIFEKIALNIGVHI